MIEIFVLDNGRVVINPNCLLIPELKAVVKAYKDPVPALSYLHFMYFPKSPYAALPEDTKEEVILLDYEGDYTPSDKEIRMAAQKLQELYKTPTQRFFFNCKKALDRLGEYVASATITEGRDGNLPQVRDMLKSVGKINQEFKQLEKAYEEEIKASIRGGAEISYDE
jgi:hypothetical protein